MRLPTSIAIPAAIGLIVLGVLGLVGTLGYLAVSYGLFINSGPRVTLPASGIALELEPGVEHAVYQEVTGAHITVNQPLVELGDDAEIVLTDSVEQTPVEFERVNWYMQVAFFGLRDRRRAVAQFTPPEPGRVTLTIADAEPGQVVYIGPTHRVYAGTTLPRVQIAALVALIAVLVGVGLILAHLVKRSHVSLDRPVTDAP